MVSCITTLANYVDLSVRQVCYNYKTKQVEFDKAAPDVEDAYRFFRSMKFSTDFDTLDEIIEKMRVLGDNEVVLVPIIVKFDHRLVFQYDEKYGNWQMGYQKKSSVEKGKAVVVDLDNDDVESEVGVCQEKRKDVDIALKYDDMSFMDQHKFKRNDDFEEIANHLVEFQHMVYNEYPNLWSKKKKKIVS